MRDDDLAAKIAEGDSAALAEAYGKYAPGLYAYCRNVLRQPADAADVVHDTFLTAAECAGQIRDGSRLRPWLYTVARNGCIRRLRAREIPVEQMPEEMADSDDFLADAGQAERAALVRDAAAGVNPAEREVLHLQLQGLDRAEQAMVLGITRNHLSALASRARAQLSECLGVLLVARNGRGGCAELDRMLGGWDGRLTPGLRRILVRHIEQPCAACHVCKHRELTPAILAGMAVPLAIADALPAGHREAVLNAAKSADPAVRAHCAAVAGHAGPFGHHDGFPARHDAPGAWHHARVFRVSAAATAVAAGLAAILLAGGSPAHVAAGSPPVAAPVSPGARPDVPPVRTSPGGGGPGTAAPAATAAVGPLATHSGRITLPPSPVTAGHVPSPVASTPGPSPTQAPPTVTPQGTLSVSPTTIVLTPLLGGTITLTASGGPVNWSISEPSSLLGTVTVSPANGTLAAGQSVTVTVTASVLSVASQMTVSPGNEMVTIVAGTGLLGRI